MLPTAIEGHALLEALYGLGILLAFLALAVITGFLSVPLVGKLTKKTKTTLDDHLVRAMRAPLVVFVALQGAFIALTATSFLNDVQRQVNNGWVSTNLVLAIWAIQRATSAFLDWYGHETTIRIGTTWDGQVIPVLRRVATFVFLAIATLMVLDRADISISPLLAGLGIGGLAVALALQPTLSNFVSGTYVLSDGSIKPGDFIEVAEGPMGTVTEVGWRATKLLTPLNNVVIVPNAKLADSIVTNYNYPTPPMSVFLTCGVSYESNLRWVEHVCTAVMMELRSRLPEADKDYQPSVLFREFSESNINFLLVMRAVDRGATFTVTHELIKAVSERFQKEGIEISYPVRKLIYPSNRINGGTKETYHSV